MSVDSKIVLLIATLLVAVGTASALEVTQHRAEEIGDDYKTAYERSSALDLLYSGETPFWVVSLRVGEADTGALIVNATSGRALTDPEAARDIFYAYEATRHITPQVLRADVDTLTDLQKDAVLWEKVSRDFLAVARSPSTDPALRPYAEAAANSTLTLTGGLFKAMALLEEGMRLKGRLLEHKDLETVERFSRNEEVLMDEMEGLASETYQAQADVASFYEASASLSRFPQGDPESEKRALLAGMATRRWRLELEALEYRDRMAVAEKKVSWDMEEMDRRVQKRELLRLNLSAPRRLTAGDTAEVHLGLRNLGFGVARDVRVHLETPGAFEVLGPADTTILQLDRNRTRELIYSLKVGGDAPSATHTIAVTGDYLDTLGRRLPLEAEASITVGGKETTFLDEFVERVKKILL